MSMWSSISGRLSNFVSSGQGQGNDQEMLFLQQENKALKGLVETRVKELKEKDDIIDSLRIEKDNDSKELDRLRLQVMCYKSAGGSKNMTIELILQRLNTEKKVLQEQNRKLRLQIKNQDRGWSQSYDPLLEEQQFRRLLKQYSELQNYTNNGAFNYRNEGEKLLAQLKFFKKVADQSVRQLMMAQELLNEEKEQFKKEQEVKEKRLAQKQSEIQELVENIEKKYPGKRSITAGVLEYLEDKRANEENTELASRDEKEQAIFNEQLTTLRREEDDVFFKEFADKEYSTPSKKNESKQSLQGTQEAPLSNLQNLFSSLTSSMVKPQSYKKALSTQKLEEEAKEILSQPEEKGWGQDLEINVQSEEGQKFPVTEQLSIEDGLTSEGTESKMMQETAPIELELDEEWL